MSLINNNFSSSEELLFTSRETKNKYILKGDTHQIKELDSTLIKQITNFSNLSSDRKNFNEIQLKHFEENAEKEKKRQIKLKSKIESDDDEEYNSLGQKKDPNIPILKNKKLSIEFLSKLYNKGIVKNSRSSTIDSNDSQKIIFKNGIKISISNPYIFSITKLHPFSFFYGTKKFIYNEKNHSLILPSPRFISVDDWRKEPDYSKEGIYKGIKIDNKNGLVVIDKVVLKKYSGLLKNMIWQILKVPFGHHISLQIKMFEPKTLIERVTNIFSYANKYLIPASNKNISSYERFKLVLTFALSGLYIPAQQLKPFNPFLGETFQGEYPNGAKVYVEQVTHTPLAMRFYITYKNIYQINGYFAFSVVSESFGNVVYINEKGPVNVFFPLLNESITYCIPKIKLLNAASDKDRSNLFEGYSTFNDIKNNIRAVVKFFENKKQFDEIFGEIFEYKFNNDFKFDYDNEWDYAKKYKLNSKKHKIFSKIEGSWLGKLIVDNKILWDIDAQNPEYIKPVKSCLPSDGRYREDLIWLYRSFYCAKDENERLLYQDIAQEWKVLMEKFNREERKIRNNMKKKKK